MMRDTHWYAVATGERSSGGWDTETASRTAYLQLRVDHKRRPEKHGNFAQI